MLCALANANPQIEFLGRLSDAAGKPLAGHHLLHFKLHGTAPGSPEQWSESLYVKTVSGEYKTLLGRHAPLPEAALRSGYRLTVSAPEGTGWNTGATAAPRLLMPPAAPLATAVSAPIVAPAGIASSVVEPAAVSAPKPQTDPMGLPSPRIYEVKPGDTLRSIALEVYGNADKWVDLYQANDDRIQRGGDLTTGQKLIVPRENAAATK